ncbi:ribonuclease H-like domain-containing protein [Tanacetum coccineum]
MMPSTSQDEIPPPPPPPSSSQTLAQLTPHTSTIKLPILKKGEYDIWAMKMEHYLAHIDYPIWEVIQNRNGPVSITTDTLGQIKVLPPRTAEEIVARERERKARTTLLMALLEDHLAKFHKMTDAKEMWDAIKSRFGGNDESKKMQKYILKQQFEGFSVSNTEGLHKDLYLLPGQKFLRSLIMTKPHNKTTYELLTGKIPIISYIRPFGCHVTILNTIDHLGKFAGKSDEGFLVGYSLQSKAFRVYNLETKRVERLKRQEQDANDAAEALRKEFVQEIKDLLYKQELLKLAVLT